jgi:chorismate dehydratase
LRVGCVKYLNARPLIHGWPGPVEFDHPSTLCRRLSAGELDVALVSSFEFLRNPIYRIVDGVSISACGPVYSVIVAHREDLSRVRQIEIDPASETSVALLRCLLAHHGLNPRLRRKTGQRPGRPEGATDEAPRVASTALFIGDQAIRFRQRYPNFPVWDLAEEWKKMVDLPFVFALWLVRPEVANASEIANRLRSLRDENLRRVDDLVAEQTEFNAEFCRGYLRDNLCFGFGDSEKAGLKEFHHQCLAQRIEVAPELKLSLV